MKQPLKPSSSSKYPVVILCGGFGTRLRGVVGDRPKVLAPVAGEPFLGHLLRHLRREGFTDVILSTGHLGERVEAFAGDGAAWGVRVRCVREPELGTGGALRHAVARARIEGTFLAMNAGTFFSGALEWLVVCHHLRKARATLALVETPEAGRYGVVRTGGKGAVTAFVERPEGAGAAWINAEVYVLEADLVAGIPAGREVSLERDVFPAWIGKGLFGCRFPDAVFLDLGVPEDYARAGDVLRTFER
ncbi:sugar phosphate nucleotidyltransferase [Rhodocaloribacter sp.]